ncbi:MAG TPA: ATP-binding protein [Solirubrobacteraceae bacterium]|nr:ATP-binding protein [Solirubrobacteraceae bacterium]
MLGLLTVFAIELADTQAKSKRDVKQRVHERGVLAAALIDSLFGTVVQQIPQDERLYGARVVSARALDRQQQQNAYIAVLDSSGRVLAHSRGFTAQARQDLGRSAALPLVSGHPYGLGNLLPYNRAGVINLAVPFPTRFGVRILLTGFEPRALGPFLSADLFKIPGVTGSHNYVLDGNDAVLGSTNAAVPVGQVLNSPAQRTSLTKASGDVNGRYYDQTVVANSTWRVVLAAPNGPLFASVSGSRKLVPWLIFVGFALVAGLALALGLRVLRDAQKLRGANVRMAETNRALEATNQELDTRARELARSNAELDQFASIASHDLKEPLRKVRTFTQQVAAVDAQNLSEQSLDYIERANLAAERMQQLIDDLLKYSRVSTHGRPFAPLDLNQLTAGVLQDLELEVVRAGAAVRVGNLPTINGDASQMRQLMQNLISNALKFRREGVPTEVTIDGTAVDGVARIVVRDNGIGFEPEYNGRIFRVFERLHGRGRYPGTGIGLALCLKIAERHGGTVTADGVPDVGASFTVTIPVDLQREVIAVPENGHQHVEEEAHVSV